LISDCDSVALIIQTGKRMRLIIFSSVTCLLLPYFVYIISQTAGFSKKKSLLNIKMFPFSLKVCLKLFYFEKNWLRNDKKCILVFMQNNRYFCPIWIKLEFSERIFKKYSNIKFHKNPSSSNTVVSGGQTGRRTDMTRLIAALPHAPKKWS